MGKKSAPPPPPDYTALAEKTNAGNVAAVEAQNKANRPDQTDIYGNKNTWTQDPTTGQWNNVQTLGASGQQKLDLQNQLLSNTAQAIQQPLTAEGLPEADLAKVRANSGMFNMDAKGNSQEIQDATYKLLNPQRQMAREGEVQRLKNQGLTEDSPAFQRAMERLDQGDTDAQLKSLIAGQQEYGNEFQRGLSANQSNYSQIGSAEQMAQALRGYGMTERGALRDQGLDEAKQLQSMLNPSFGSFMNAGSAGGVDYLGAGDKQYAAELEQANAKKKASGGMMSGLGTLAGGAAGAFFGGPAGAMLGAKLGGAAGGMIGGG